MLETTSSFAMHAPCAEMTQRKGKTLHDEKKQMRSHLIRNGTGIQVNPLAGRAQ